MSQDIFDPKTIAEDVTENRDATYMTELDAIYWEKRAKKAEAELERLRKILARVQLDLKAAKTVIAAGLRQTLAIVEAALHPTKEPGE